MFFPCFIAFINNVKLLFFFDSPAHYEKFKVGKNFETKQVEVCSPEIQLANIEWWNLPPAKKSSSNLKTSGHSMDASS